MKDVPLITDHQMQVVEFMKCQAGIDGFAYFCSMYGRIQEKESAKAVPFKFYRCQAEVSKKLVAKRWLRIMKARRLGFTWLLAAYCVWLCVFYPMQTIAYIVHKREFAGDFISYCKFIHEHLPEWLRLPITSETKWRLDFNSDGHGSWIRALAATPGAADSLAVNVGIIDEGTKIEALNPGLLKNIFRSLEPTVETSKGFCVQIATSEGPTGDFFKGWKESERGKDRYENIFYGWKARPGRTKKWYDREAERHKGDPTYMFRQYPSSVEEAFSHAEGRVYPTFTTATHVARIDEDCDFSWGKPAEPIGPHPGANDAWPKWRGIDFGGVDPFVTLWIALIPGYPSGLIIDPSCEELIREMQSYRRKAGSEYLVDKDNHGPDCLRYVIVTFNLQGLLYVYRELFVPDSAAKGLSLPDLAMQVKELSGDEEYRMSVADRSRTDSILILNRHGISCVAHMKPSGGKDTKTHEVEQGIVRVNTLLMGNYDIFPRHEVDPDVKAFIEHRKSAAHDPGVSIGLAEHRETKALIERIRKRPEMLRAPSRTRRIRVRRFK